MPFAVTGAAVARRRLVPDGTIRALWRYPSDQMDAATPRLVPLIAHDRAGFGSTILVGGLLASGAALHARGSRSLWQAVVAAGLLAFGPAIVVHHVVGYTDPFHLAPAHIGASVLALGLLLSRPSARRTAR